jgi:hypothetical protein
MTKNTLVLAALGTALLLGFVLACEAPALADGLQVQVTVGNRVPGLTANGRLMPVGTVGPYNGGTQCVPTGQGQYAQPVRVLPPDAVYMIDAEHYVDRNGVIHYFPLDSPLRGGLVYNPPPVRVPNYGHTTYFVPRYGTEPRGLGLDPGNRGWYEGGAPAGWSERPGNGWGRPEWRDDRGQWRGDDRGQWRGDDRGQWRADDGRTTDGRDGRYTQTLPPTNQRLPGGNWQPYGR